MPKQAHLPPRCPSQIRVPSTQPISPLASPVTRNAGPDPSHLPLLEEEPSWFDDLLGGPDSDSPKGIFHRRSASDSSALLSISSSLTKPTSLFEVGNVSDETCKMGTIEESLLGTEACSGLEKGCVYGPNSPRKMSGLTDSESSMVSALLENATQNPLRCLSEDLSYVFESGEFDAAVDAFNAEVNPDPKPKAVKSLM
ncbi:hypothetical protein QJS10_CPA02g01060 [Acorus calamus]|uniref:Uncharacterized protein n=1 Tax=Acorus calamus TaxID=4465 RepID=A0AAV9FAN8_ACOCL|nr:hypothetical protein QJS10_CPA02g01060 [Acorus calamus]